MWFSHLQISTLISKYEVMTLNKFLFISVKIVVGPRGNQLLLSYAGMVLLDIYINISVELTWRSIRYKKII